MMCRIDSIVKSGERKSALNSNILDLRKFVVLISSILVCFAVHCLAADQSTVLVVAQDGSRLFYHQNGTPLDMEEVPKGTELTIESVSGDRCFVTYKGKPAYIRREFLVTKQEFLAIQQRARLAGDGDEKARMTEAAKLKEQVNADQVQADHHDETRAMADGGAVPSTQTTDTSRVITTDRVTTTEPVTPLYEPFPAHQLSLQAFGTYASRDREGISNTQGGGGLGLTYFFTRYVGIGADSYIEEWKWPYRLNGSFILRLPLPEQFSRLAVYGFGGGGRQFKDIPQFTWHGGGGLEYKFSRCLGIFADVREVFPDKTPNYTLLRGGVSFGF
jgi:hypothetical protein